MRLLSSSRAEQTSCAPPSRTTGSAPRARTPRPWTAPWRELRRAEADSGEIHRRNLGREGGFPPPLFNASAAQYSAMRTACRTSSTACGWWSRPFPRSRSTRMNTLRATMLLPPPHRPLYERVPRMREPGSVCVRKCQVRQNAESKQRSKDERHRCGHHCPQRSEI